MGGSSNIISGCHHWLSQLSTELTAYSAISVSPCQTSNGHISCCKRSSVQVSPFKQLLVRSLMKSPSVVDLEHCDQSVQSETSKTRMTILLSVYRLITLWILTYPNPCNVFSSRQLQLYNYRTRLEVQVAEKKVEFSVHSFRVV